MRIRPDITDTLLRREINFLSSIKDGSKKIGELHVNRLNYRNFEANDTNVVKRIFSWFWMRSLIRHLKCLDCFVVLTEEDKINWPELDNVISIPNPITFNTDHVSNLNSNHVLAVGRYAYQKGYDMLLAAWAIVEKKCPKWELFIYGQGERKPYEDMAAKLRLKNCHLNGSVSNIQERYLDSSLFVISSRFEGLSMSLLEAMSFGLPVVSFACPCGFKDVISSGVNGVLVPEGNVELLAEKIVEMMNKELESQGMRSVILYYGYREKSTKDLEAIIRSYNNDKNEVVAVYLDYIKRIRPGRTDSAATASEKSELHAIMNELKNIAAEFDIPIVTGHQLNREAARQVDDVVRNGGFNKTDQALGRSNISVA
jgi:glycosyltransferase involved in cell wall biosynthesis